MRLQAAPCGHLAFDDERRITAVNDQASRHLGYEPVELVGQSLNVLLPPAVRILFHTSVFPVLAEGRQVEETYAVLRSKNGQELPVLLNAARRLHAGIFETDCIFLVVKRRNLFERHLQRLEAMRPDARTAPLGAAAAADGRQLNQRDELAERMSTLGLLQAGIMHEVRNPLTYVYGNLQFLSDELEKSGQGAVDARLAGEYLSEVRDGLARIHELVNAVGVASRIESAGSVPVDVGHAIDVAVRLVRHRVLRSAQLEVVGPRPGATVLGDEARLAQVVMNLIINASQAMCDMPSTEARIRVSNAVEGDLALIEVSDNGPGVPPGLRERIFEPFYTTKPVGEGTGLGLAICVQIVSSLGGSLVLRSPPGGGATFRVAVPLL